MAGRSVQYVKYLVAFCQLSTTPKWKIQPNTQNAVDGKEDFIGDIIIASGVNKTNKTQASPEVAHESPFFMNVFLAVGGHCTASTSGRVRQHLTREESWNNRDKK